MMAGLSKRTVELVLQAFTGHGTKLTKDRDAMKYINKPLVDVTACFPGGLDHINHTGPPNKVCHNKLCFQTHGQMMSTGTLSIEGTTLASRVCDLGRQSGPAPRAET